MLKTLLTGLFCCGLCLFNSQAQQYNLDIHIKLLENGPASTYVQSYWRDFALNDIRNFPGWDSLSSNGYLVSPLISQGTNHRKIETIQEWDAQRAWIKGQFQHWILGSLPPQPEAFNFQILKDSIAPNLIRHQYVRVKFGPSMKGQMDFKLFIPPSNKPLPVFMTQWNHEQWAYIAVRRGYIGCVYAGADSKDDAKVYSEIYPDHDFSLLTARAWGAMRVVDYLHTLPFVDTDKIGLTGHSRNGKQALIAAAFDDRIDAVLASTGAIGGGLPFRFTDSKYDSESIEDVFANFPNWFHPRLMYFMGNEDKLPVDQHHLAALIAPRSLGFATGYLEATSNMVGLEQLVLALDPAYRIFGENSKEKVTLLTRNGLHGTAARDIERYIDFFDRAFGLKNVENPLGTFYGFKLKENQVSSKVDFFDLPFKNFSDSIERRNLISKLKDHLGDEPPGIKNNGPGDLTSTRNYDDWVAKLMAAQDVIKDEEIGEMLICPYNAMGDYLFANLYYPKNIVNQKNKIPAVIFLHSYSTATGFRWRIAPFIQTLVRKGIAVLAFDQIGFGTRMEEGTQFEQRYPSWSRMGKMVSDVKGGIDALENFDWINAEEIYLAGDNMGSQIGALTSALDTRVKGLMAYAGLGSLEFNEHSLHELSNEFGLMPTIFSKSARPTFDWIHVLALNAQKKILLIDPLYDRHSRNNPDSIDELFSYLESKSPYFKHFQPEDWNRFRENQQVNSAHMFLELIRHQ